MAHIISHSCRFNDFDIAKWFNWRAAHSDLTLLVWSNGSNSKPIPIDLLTKLA